MNFPPFPLHSVFDYIALICLLLLLGLVIGYYPELPAEIPTHFGPNGAADAWGAKTSIFILPVLGLIIYVLLGFLGHRSRAARLDNPWSTLHPRPGMEEEVRKLTVDMLGALRAMVILAFTYINWGSIRTAFGDANGLGSLSILFILLVILGPTFYYTWLIVQRSK